MLSNFESASEGSLSQDGDNTRASTQGYSLSPSSQVAYTSEGASEQRKKVKGHRERGRDGHSGNGRGRGVGGGESKEGEKGRGGGGG